MDRETWAEFIYIRSSFGTVCQAVIRARLANAMKNVLAVGVALFIAAPAINAQTPKYETAVRPVLAKHCFSCHNAKLTFGKLDLEAIREGGDASSKTGVWERVREKVSSGKMPPPGSACCQQDGSCGGHNLDRLSSEEHGCSDARRASREESWRGG